MNLKDSQEKVIKLLGEATPKEHRQRWLKGYIPTHYKRLSISMDEAKELAIVGASEAMAYFENKLYFTQALLFGAVVSNHYKNIIVVTPSQYGKSWLSSQIAIWLADNKHTLYIAGGTTSLTEIIMGQVTNQIQKVDIEVKSKLLESVDKLERLQTILSKKKIALRGGGSIEGISLGEHFNGNIKNNQAVGRGGDYIIDEASLVSDETYAEMGRRQFANDSGDSYISFEISNPHNPGRFYDKLTTDSVPTGTLIVWMDIRTSYEEGRVKSTEQVTQSEFFQKKSTCQRYLLCELEDFSSEQMFGEPRINNDLPKTNYTYFLGVDSAYKGKDNIVATIVGKDDRGQIRAFKTIKIDKLNWEDGITSQKIIRDLLTIIKKFNIKNVCVDIGYGVYIVEGLAKFKDILGFGLQGINFGSSPTKERIVYKDYSALYAANKRAEMHMDLADLIDNKAIMFTQEVYESVSREMSVIQSIIKKNGKTGVMPKDDIKRMLGKSPDELDSLLLAVHSLILYYSGNRASENKFTFYS